MDLASRVEFNPRGQKRLINLLQLVAEIGKIRPVDDDNPMSSTLVHWHIGGRRPWRAFCEKAVLWLFLCQNFLFRMSLLLQILLDFEQKRVFNAMAAERTADQPFGFSYRQCSMASVSSDCDSSDPDRSPPQHRLFISNQTTPSVSYKQSSSSRGNNSAAADEPQDVDNVTIYQFYFDHVDKYVHAFTRASRFARQDKDPEDFSKLLLRTLDIASDGSAITCADVLGPRYSSYYSSSGETVSASVESARNKSFALGSYSFNLDPALKLEVRLTHAGLFRTSLFQVFLCFYFIIRSQRK